MTDKSSTQADWKHRLRPRPESQKPVDQPLSGSAEEELPKPGPKVKEEAPDMPEQSAIQDEVPESEQCSDVVEYEVESELSDNPVPDTSTSEQADLPVYGCTFDEIPSECDLPARRLYRRMAKKMTEVSALAESQGIVTPGRLLEEKESTLPCPGEQIETIAAQNAPQDAVSDAANEALQGQISTESNSDDLNKDVIVALSEEEIRKDYNLTNSEWVLVAPKKLRSILEGMTPRCRVEYSWHQRKWPIRCCVSWKWVHSPILQHNRV
jgi:hypothetical protein